MPELSVSEQKELNEMILLAKAVKKLIDLGLAATSKEALALLK
jgi:hypothetical protein